MSEPQPPDWKPGQPPPWDQPAPLQPPAAPQGQWAPGQPPTDVPWTPMPQQPPAKKSFLRRFDGLIAVGVIVALALGGVYLFRDQLTGRVAELRAGDCFDEPADISSDDAEVKEVQHRPCTQPHDGEVFFVVDHPAAKQAAYPTTDERTQFVAERCLPAFQSYTSRSFDSAAELDMAWFYPTTDGWSRRNDREFTCYTYRVDGTKLSSSVKAAAPTP